MDPITEFVQAAVLAFGPPGEMIAVTEHTDGPVLMIDVRVKTRTGSGWLIGHKGAGVALMLAVADRALLGRLRFDHGARFTGVSIHIEADEASREHPHGGRP